MNPKKVEERCLKVKGKMTEERNLKKKQQNRIDKILDRICRTNQGIKKSQIYSFNNEKETQSQIRYRL